ncbi:hypothetical protein BH20ACT3_BH20ACT3_08190 [soil metagenome]
MRSASNDYDSGAKASSCRDRKVGGSQDGRGELHDLGFGGGVAVEVEDQLVGASRSIGSGTPGWANPGRTPRSGATVAGRSDEVPVTVRFYSTDGSTFIDGDYLIKGVPSPQGAPT